MKRTIALGLAAAAALVIIAQSPAAALQQEIVSTSAVYNIDFDTEIVGGTAELVFYSVRSDFNARVCNYGNPNWDEHAFAELKDVTTGEVLGTITDTTQDGTCVYQWIPGKVAGHTYKLTIRVYSGSQPQFLYGSNSKNFTPAY